MASSDARRLIAAVGLAVVLYLLFSTFRSSSSPSEPPSTKDGVRRDDALYRKYLVDAVGLVAPQRLIPNEKGLCYFHGQRPHHQDRGVFERLGGKVLTETCLSAPKQNVKFTSEAEVCECVAPPSEAFGLKYLEIGAADGQYLSNLNFFDTQMAWKGICVEGSPTSFPLLTQNRPNCINIHAVIGSDPGTKNFFTFDAKEEGSWEIGMSCMEGVGICSDDASAQNYATENNLSVRKDAVPMKKLSDIFRQHGFTQFGWIMIDVEGAEDLVVQTIDFTEVSADLVTLENVHPISEKHLAKAGYHHTGNFGVDRMYTKK